MKQLSGDALEDLMQKYADLTHRFEMENGYAYKKRTDRRFKGPWLYRGRVSETGFHALRWSENPRCTRQTSVAKA